MSVEIFKHSNGRFGWRVKSGSKVVKFPENRLSPLTRELSDEEASSYRQAVQVALSKLYEEQQRTGAK